MSKKTPQHYVDNKKFYAEMVKYLNNITEAKKDNKPIPRIPEYLGECIYLIANKLAMSPNFIGYSYRDEMIADGIENCMMYIDRFDPVNYDNPFTYFTQINWYAFVRRIQKEKKQQYIKAKMLINSSVMNTLVEQSEGSGHFNAAYIHLDEEKTNDLIAKFENPEKNPSKSKRKKGVEKFIESDEDEAAPKD